MDNERREAVMNILTATRHLFYDHDAAAAAASGFHWRYSSPVMANEARLIVVNNLSTRLSHWFPLLNARTGTIWGGYEHDFNCHEMFNSYWTLDVFEQIMNIFLLINRQDFSTQTNPAAIW